MKATTRTFRPLRFTMAAIVALVVLAGTTACQPTTVSITASLPSTLTLGSSTAITGKVTPARTGGTVVVERLMSGKWVERAKGTLSSKSTYRITLTPSQRATYTLRVRRLATGTDAAATSPTVKLNVIAPPGAPQQVKAQRVTDSRNDNGGFATVSWVAADPSGDPHNTRYRVTTSPATSVKETDQTSIEWSGLDPWTAYRFTVVALNRAGTGPAASAAPIYAEGRPAPPIHATFLPANGSVQMSGLSSPDPRGPGTITFEYSTSSATSGFAALGGTSFPLPNGATVPVWIRACKYTVDSSGTSIGCGVASQASNSTTGSTTVTPFGPAPLSASVADRTITWAWGSTPAGVSSYEVMGQDGLTACGANCRSKTFGYGETRCLRVDAVGQGVTIIGPEVCRTTDPGPQPVVTISKGPSVSMPNCTTACKWIRVDTTDFPAGTHQVSCWSNQGGWASFFTYSTAQTTSQDCYYGAPGTQVYVVVDGIQSNTLTW